MKTNTHTDIGHYVYRDSNGAYSQVALPAFVSDFTLVFDEAHGDFKTPNATCYSFQRYNPYYSGSIKSQTIDRFDPNSPENVVASVSGISGIGFGLPDTSDDPSVGNVESKALSNLFQQIRGGLDLSVSIAEAHQVSRMMKSVLKISNILRRFHPKQWGNTWLEYQYGVRPLLSDVYNTANQLLNIDNPNGPMVFRARAVELGDKTLTYDYSTPRVKRKLRILVSSRCEIVARFKFDSSTIPEIARFSGLNPVGLAWELLPYSFVADWFLNIGGYLKNLESYLLYRSAFRGGYITFTKRREIQGSIVGSESYISGRYRHLDSYNLSGSSVQVDKLRSVILTLPIDRPPSFKADLGATRLLSAASLLSQFLKK
jgi:hypothetical protein